MAFRQVVFQLRNINSFPSKCRFLPRLPLFATRQSARLTHTFIRLPMNSTDVSKIVRNSFGEFVFNTISIQLQIWYSYKESNKYSRKSDEDDDSDDDDDDDDDNCDCVQIVLNIFLHSNVFRTMKILWNIFYMLKYLDRQFLFADFVIGTRQALQVISHKLAEGDFENLKEFVEANELKCLQGVVGGMTATQRKGLAINKDDIVLTFIHDVVITKERDTTCRTKRVFAEVSLVFVTMRTEQRLNDSCVDKPINIQIGSTPEIAGDQMAVHYRFNREFNE